MKQLLRKISAATVFGTKGDVLELCMKDKTASHPLYRVVGIANEVLKGKSKFEDKEEPQEWTALLGSFEAINLQTGEVFRSGKCFMPNYVVDSVAGQFVEGVESVRFGFDIAAKYSEKSITSYEYFATPLIEPAEGDPLTALASSLPPAVTTSKQLEGPKGKK